MRFLTIIMMAFVQETLLAQTLFVEKLQIKTSDVSARTKPRLDVNAVECGLIKVLSNQKDVTFLEAVGNVENKTNEYWVYASSGTKKLTISLGGAQIVVNTSDYGIDNIESKTTYEMKLAIIAKHNSFNHKNTPKDFLESAEKGDAEAECNLGKCHYLGQGATQNFYAALTWFRKSAEKNYPEAQYYIGRCYYYGQGFPKPDFQQAAIWFEKAANQDYADAQYQLGLCYERGQGVKQNLKKAQEWYEKAVANGNNKAKQKIR